MGMDKIKVMDLLRCAVINCDNVKRLGFPMLEFVKIQLNDALAEMQKVDAPDPEGIKVGDVVRLKSGGPPMLVIMFMGETRDLYCFWGKPESIGVGTFAQVTVDLVLRA